MKKHKAYLIKKKKIVFVDTIHWNKGYGGALQIHVPNPEFDPVKHIIDIASDPMTDPFRVGPFFTYINHTLEAHLKDTPHEFILLRPTELQDKNDVDLYEGDSVEWRSGRTGHIKYSNACFLIEWDDDCYATLLGWDLWERGIGMDKSKIERIGSIHDK